MRGNIFGGTLGGPIRRDKLFFFVDYQGSRVDTPTSVNATTVFTPAERAGDFSALLTQARPIQLYNPFSFDSSGARAPFANNIIPVSLFNPSARQILASQSYPLPTNGSLLNNLQYGVRTAINGDQGDVKIDYNVSDKDRIFGRYSQSSYTNPTFRADPVLYDSFANYPTHTGVVDWTRTVSPTVVNEARFGVNYVFLNNGAASNSLSNFPQSVGIQGVPTSFLPSLSFTGGNVSSFGTSDVYQLFADAVIHYEDTLIVTKGNHTMRMGFQAYRYRVDTFYSGNNGVAGTILFNGYYTTKTPGSGASSANGGIAEADFLLGLPNEIQGGVNGGTWGQRAASFGAYYQDDWRVTPNLTLNLGLRWELHTPWVEVKNRQANFDLVTGAESIAGQNGASRALYNQYNGITNFQPRVGAAWTPGGGKLVIRAGYSLSNYLEGTGTNLRLPLNPPFAVEHDNTYSASGNFQALPGSRLDQGFLPFLSNPGDQFHNVTLRVWDPNIRPAVANQWNLAIQRQLTGSTTATVAYVGQRSTHLAVATPYFQRVLNSNGSVSPTRYLEGNPALLADIGQISGTSSLGNQNYEALQVTVGQRLSNGLQFTANYTYSKCLTNSIGYYGQGGQAATASAYFQNVYNAKAEYGPCDYDAAHNFVGNAVYSLPVGRDRKYGKGFNKALDAVIGGWQASGILSLHTGFPLTVNATDVSGTNARGARANCIAPGVVFGQQNAAQGGYQYFSPASYAQPASGTFGDCGVGTIRGPGLSTLDLNVSKNFAITEHQHVEVRAEFINLSNTPILNAPTRSVGSTLGLLQNSQGARNIQIALKYRF